MQRGDVVAALEADARGAGRADPDAGRAPQLRRWADAAGAAALIAAGRVAEAPDRLGELTDERGFSAAWQRVWLARAHLETGALHQAEEVLRPMTEPGWHYREPVVAARLMLAIIAEKQHRDGVALAHVTRAVDLAQPEGIRRPFLQLAGRLIGNAAPVPGARGHQRGVRSPNSTGPPPTNGTDGGGQLEHLTERELIVLKYLPTMLKAGEIADDLFVSVNTVKAHLRSMYRKLGVSNRREAVEQARARACCRPSRHCRCGHRYFGAPHPGTPTGWYMLATRVDHRRNGHYMPRHGQHSASDEDVAPVIGGAPDDGVGPGPVNRTPSRRSAVLRAIGLIGVVVVWLAIAGRGRAGNRVAVLGAVQRPGIVPAGRGRIGRGHRGGPGVRRLRAAARIRHLHHPDGADGDPRPTGVLGAYTESLADAAGQQRQGRRPRDRRRLPGRRARRGRRVPIPLIPSRGRPGGAGHRARCPQDKVTAVDADGQDPLGDVVDALRTAGEATVACRRRRWRRCTSPGRPG